MGPASEAIAMVKMQSIDAMLMVLPVKTNFLNMSLSLC